MRYFILLCFIASFTSRSQIILTDETLNHSCAGQTIILEDAEHKLTVEDILKLPNERFRPIKNKIEILDFNDSRWWIKIYVRNESSTNRLILDVARPITNVVNLYIIDGDSVVKVMRNGDDLPFESKAYKHRKSMFNLNLKPGEEAHYIVELESDGEVISLPIRFWNSQQFHENDYLIQYVYGIYYGILILIAFIFFFFYLVLKDRSFLYYVIYVIFQMLLQFGLDGYAYQYIFPDGGYMTDHIVLIAAGNTVVFVILYARSFLKSKILVPKMDRLLLFSFYAVGIITLLSLIPGVTYQLAYPLINGFSLLGVLLILTTIVVMRRKGHRVDPYFTTAFVILISGAVVFILGNFHLAGNADISQAAIKFGSALEVMALSVSMANEYRRLQGEKEEAQREMLRSLEQRNELIDKMNLQLERQVAERTREIEQQKEELAAKNDDILSSIKYAQRIQEAILPSEKHIKKILPQSFVLYLPRDIVSGDFYFVEEVETTDIKPKKLKLFAAVDCTGHGVPGAFMSIVGNNYLRQGLTESHVNSPAQALDYLNSGVVKTLYQQEEINIKDGMDLALCGIDESTGTLVYSGAKNPLYIVRKNDGSIPDDGPNTRVVDDAGYRLLEIKSDRHAIGAFIDEVLPPYSDVSFQLQPGDMIYVFTDGFADQFGGEKGKKFTYGKFKKLLISVSQLPPEEQKNKLYDSFKAWKSDHEQIDDVLVLGVRYGLND